MTTYNDDEKKKGQAKFNAGIAKLQRIHNCRLVIHNARITDDFSIWFKCLKSWRSEINDRFDEKMREEAGKYEETISSGLYAYVFRQSKMMTNHGFVDDSKASRGLQFEKNLYDYELWLADKEREFGYGMPEQDEDLGL